MKTICMYAPQLHMVGGIESVIRDLYKILPDTGIRVVAACEFGKPDWIADEDYMLLPSNANSRAQFWQVFLSRNNVDCVIIHHQLNGLITKDIPIFRNLGVKCVRMMHGSFPAALLLEGAELHNKGIDEIGRQCDAIFTVSQIDAKFWTALGHKAICIQNPIRVPKKNAGMRRQDGREPGVTNIVWVGRQCEQKQPSAALDAFARACCKTAKVRLTMIGGSSKGWKPHEKEAERLGVADKVEFLPARSDITDIWNKADIHLLTSITESFCLVLAEAKSMGIPSIMFDLPYLELTASNKGLVVLPQGDIEGMADVIVRMVDDQQLREKLGREARESLADFCCEKVVADWHRALEAVESGKGFAEVSDDARVITYQLSFAWNRYCGKNLWLVRMEENARRLGFSFWGGARMLSWLIAGLRRMRYLNSAR